MQLQGLGWVQALGERSSGQTLGLVTVGLCVWGWSHPSGAGGREGCQAQEGPAGPWGTQCALYAALGWSPSQGPAGATWGALPVPGPVGRPPPLRWWPPLHPLHPPRPGRHPPPRPLSVSAPPPWTLLCSATWRCCCRPSCRAGSCRPTCGGCTTSAPTAPTSSASTSPGMGVRGTPMGGGQGPGRQPPAHPPSLPLS